MIPLDRHFTELLNETIPFPLQQDTAPVVAKIVPTPVAAAKKATVSETAVRSEQVNEFTSPVEPLVEPNAPEESQKQEQPVAEAPVTFASSTFDCHCETVYCQSNDNVGKPELALFLQPEETEASLEISPVENVREEIVQESANTPEIKCATKISPAHESPISKVEISAERSVPFKIDPLMLINRPRLTLKDSGLPIALTPAEADPSIVGESVLGFKLESLSPEAASKEQEIHGDISSEMINLLEQQSDRPETPTLKAFNPEEFSDSDITSAVAQKMEREEVDLGYDKTLSEFLYDNACEVGDEFDEYDELAEDHEAIEEAIREEEARLAAEAGSMEAVELVEDVTEEDIELYEAAATAIEEAVEEDVIEAEIAEKAFYPMLQVDRFAWPNFCLDMHPIIKTQLGHLGDQLIDKMANSDRNVIAVVGSGPGAGSTSILLGLATALEAAGQKVAIIDANINSPTLASSLGLQPEYGWETVTTGRLPIEESLIDSIEDRITLLPLCLDASEKITFGVRPSENDRMNAAMRQMKDYYDFILVDLGSPGVADIAAFSNMSEWIDSAVVVHNLRDGNRAQLIQAKNLMRDYGVSIAGIAENFAPRESCFQDEEYRAA